MPNPSELERQRLEEELGRHLSKKEKEHIIRQIRELERQLGVTPRPYNQTKGSKYV